jgi:hypothetical protein
MAAAMAAAFYGVYSTGETAGGGALPEERVMSATERSEVSQARKT